MFKIYYYYSYKWNPVLNRICLKKFKIFKKFLTSINESNTVLKTRVEVTSTEFRGGEGYLFFLSNFWFHLVSFYPLLSHTESRSCVFWKVRRSLSRHHMTLISVDLWSFNRKKFLLNKIILNAPWGANCAAIDNY